MAKRKEPKFYVVWRGVRPGVYTTWAECERQVHGFEGAQYRSYPTRQLAEEAFSKPYTVQPKATTTHPAASSSRPVYPSLAVDAACNMRTGVMEYRGVDAATRKVIFQSGPYLDTTNNVGEFLALVHALALLANSSDPAMRTLPIYSDSQTAMAWVRRKQANTKMQATPSNATLREIIARAERWLETHTWQNPILKWDTEAWGEIPADFGRK